MGTIERALLPLCALFIALGRHIPIHKLCRTFPLGVRSLAPDCR